MHGEAPRLPSGMTERVQRLRGLCERNPDASTWRSPYGGQEAFHEEWLLHEDEHYMVRLARAQAAWRASVDPVITPGQLVVGTPPPVAIVTYGSGTFDWDFKIDESLVSHRPDGHRIAAYWREFLAARPAPETPAALRDMDLSSTLWISGVCCHSTQDYSLALGDGLDGIRRRAASARERVGEGDAWYQALDIALDGAARFMSAHADALDAELRAGAAPREQLEEWRRIVEGTRHVAGGERPRGFLEAAQLFWFLFILNGHDSPGRMDQYLWPHLGRDLESGRLDLVSAQEQVDCLYLKLAEHLCYGATLGGQLPDGGDATNTLTWLSLNSIRRLRLISPRTALRWHRDTPRPLFEAAVDCLASGATYPPLVNDEVVVPSLESRGLASRDARDYTFCGCGQVIPSGRSYGSYEDLILNAAKPITLAMHRGRDELTGIRNGPDTGALDVFGTYDEFAEAVWAQLVHVLEIGIAADVAHKRWAADRLPDFLRSAVTRSCVDRGKDWRSGGADYHLGQIDAVGLTNLSDSLLAVKEIVFERRRVSLEELRDALDENWEGRETLRRECFGGVAKFGNDCDDADGVYVATMKRLNEWLMTRRTLFGGAWGIDIIGWTGAVTLGEGTGATPDGRRRGEPLADSGGPCQGRDVNGPTAMLSSMSKLPLEGTLGPVALNMRLGQSTVRGERGRRNFASLLLSYMKSGGMQIQPTIAGADAMRAALEDPEAYRDLIVRIGGFSAYFVELDRRYQQDLIRRTEHEMA